MSTYKMFRNNNSYLFIFALVLGASLAVGASVWATSIGTNVSVSGTLTSTGNVTFNGSNTFGDAAADINLFTGKLHASTTALFTSGLQTYDAITADITRATGATGSYQPFAGDLTYQGAAGGTSSFHAGVMGHFKGSALTNTVAGYHAGVIGAYSVATSDALTGPKAGVVATLGANDAASVGVADGAFMAVLDGGDPSVQVTANAAYGVQYLNTLTTSKFTYGVDLRHAAVGDFKAVSFDIADIRLQSGDTIKNASASSTQISGKIVLSPTFNTAGSQQAVEADANIGNSFGTASAGDSDFGAAVMGNLLGTNTLASANNYLAGVIGAYSLTGTVPSDYPKGGVLGLVGPGVVTNTADGAVVAVLDGDTGQVNATAAFRVMSLNSTAASGFSYGLDLYGGAAHDSYLTTADMIDIADIRLQNQETISNETDGVIRIDGGTLAQATSTVASAATMTLPDANVVNVTGTTNITTMNTCDTPNEGRVVTLIFAGILTFTDGNNLKLAGNFTTSADDTITLTCFSTNWYEIARSAN